MTTTLKIEIHRDSDGFYRATSEGKTLVDNAKTEAICGGYALAKVRRQAIDIIEVYRVVDDNLELMAKIKA